MNNMNTGDAICVCTVAALYSTGHWIGATVVLTLMLLVKLDILS